MFKKVFSFYIISIFGILSVFSQKNSLQEKLQWASEIVSTTPRFEEPNNNAKNILGPPTVYPDVNLEAKYDQYAEGFILYPDPTPKKNVIIVKFPLVMSARQVMLGGVFNEGVIKTISYLTKEGKEKIIYSAPKPSTSTKNKFRTFKANFTLSTIYQLKITLDHKYINEWNILKGIGISNSATPFDVNPYIIKDTLKVHEKEQVGTNINSADCFEFGPKISPEGRVLYFVKECVNQADQDIYYSEMDEKGMWKEAVNIGKPLNNSSHNFVASISSDGNTLLIGNKYNTDGSAGGNGVSMSQRLENGSWSMPVSMDIPNLINFNDHANYFLSSDEKALFISMENEKGLGELDLYVSLKNKYTNKWGDPINLGSTINTKYAEDYPFLASDGETLFFSSKGYLGYGGHDIWMSKKLDDSYTNWSKPINIGPFINTKSDDKGFVIAASGDHAYFNSASAESDQHHMDIFKVNLPKSLHQTPRYLYSGKVASNTTNEPIRAKISFMDPETNTEISHVWADATTGKYSMSLPAGKKYKVSVDAINYFKSFDNIDLTKTSDKFEYSKDYLISPFLDSGQAMVFKNILFDRGKETLKEESFEVLDQIIVNLKQQNHSILEIGGHTDAMGRDEDNLELSVKRAKTVVDYLISKGIKDWRLKYKGYGETMPLSDNETDEGKSLNRRVVFTILEKDITERARKKREAALKKQKEKNATSRFSRKSINNN